MSKQKKETTSTEVPKPVVKTLSDAMHERLIHTVVGAILASPTACQDLIDGLKNAKETLANKQSKAQDDLGDFAKDPANIALFDNDPPAYGIKMSEVSDAFLAAMNMTVESLMEDLGTRLGHSPPVVAVFTERFGTLPRATKLDFVCGAYNDDKGFVFEPLVDGEAKLTDKVQVWEVTKLGNEFTFSKFKETPLTNYSKMAKDNAIAIMGESDANDDWLADHVRNGFNKSSRDNASNGAMVKAWVDTHGKATHESLLESIAG